LGTVWGAARRGLSETWTGEFWEGDAIGVLDTRDAQAVDKTNPASTAIQPIVFMPIASIHSLRIASIAHSDRRRLNFLWFSIQRVRGENAKTKHQSEKPVTFSAR
jgi:hypothetical protein